METKQSRWIERKVKRVVDLAAASAGLYVLAPVLLGSAVAVWATLGRPILFRQKRPGLHNVPFTIYKFRTMRAPKNDEVWFRSDAQRVTKLGWFLRKTSIDELPELFNVIKGEMSLVGPRPLLMEYLEKYSPEELRRHEVPPGITGWAQVNGRQNIPFSERLRLDVWYVDHFSLGLDLRILAKTLLAVLRSTGVDPRQNLDDVDDIGLSADRSRAKGTEGAPT